ncbi:ABC transporter substrate-binding protein [Shewanella sp. VB17]|uniref:substrate-binding periplasmic protein n=1 Tax=Shewanella sp. VB17 TaxID=2739432 RepID=UPI001564CBBA|nr:ABC transporter substrate-binding protein [Shewanella sp. VB17]NRD72139.1 ABC transporter substrate-binding protein [Shewanella sp. VB17]
MSFLHIEFFLSLTFLSLFFSTITANELNITIGSSLPPYVISSDDNGIEIDIVRSAFEAVDHTVNFQYVPTARLFHFIKNNTSDGIVENGSYDISKEIGKTMYTSKDIISMKNVVIAFKNKKLAIVALENLSTLKIIAFQNAHKYLGKDFFSAIRNNPEYREHAHQHLQVRQLYAGRVDAVISDQRIFMYWRQLAYKQGKLSEEDMKSPLIFYPLFTPSIRNLKTINRKIRDKFNLGLNEIIENGTYQEILNKYKN